MGEENEITRMLTQCALRDELLAEAILQSAMHICRKRTESTVEQNFSLNLKSQNHEYP